MVANFVPNGKLTTSEIFFVEKLLELFHTKTIDSHRAKLHNPKRILSELLQILTDYQGNKIKHFDKTVKPVILESLQFIENEKELKFTTLKKNYYIILLKSATDKQYVQLLHATKLVLDDNKKYVEYLFTTIFGEILRLNGIQPLTNPEELDYLSTLLDHLASELLNLNFSKDYLHKVILKKFEVASQSTFKDSFRRIKKLGARKKEHYNVIFSIKRPRGKTTGIKPFGVLSAEQIADFEKVNDRAQEFFINRNRNTYYISVALEGKDYLSVIENAQKKIFHILDILNLGFPDNPFHMASECLVIGQNYPSQSNIQSCAHEVEGHYNNKQNIYEQLAFKIDGVLQKKEIQKETKLKVLSALRHLRLGRDVNELEQKFLNYWIGLEYIFSNYDIRENHTISRLKEYFVYAHVQIYTRRNIHEFHRDLIRLKLPPIQGLNNDLQYLKSESTYDFIISNYLNTRPLLAFRASKYKTLISDPKASGRFIDKHRNNLEWHLARSYRIRNEIVHDAAIHLNIDLITANLKYYLTFILSCIIEYLANTPTDLDLDGMIGIEDYFMLQEIRYKSIENAGFNFNDLMAQKSITEIFS